MTPRRAALAACLALSLGCFHTRHVSDTGQDDDQKKAGEGERESKQEQGGSQRATKGRVPPREGRPAVASTPEGLMNPGSTRRIQEALRSGGYLDEVSGELDPATSAALRRFQRDHDLAETGAPDRETLRQLGVDPKEVYRTAQ
jgi:peptidoglycan hydrolase-like protein with peptidoglycan-binding domain